MKQWGLADLAGLAGLAGFGKGSIAIRLVASGLMAFGAEYALQAFSEYVDDMTRARGEVA